MKNFFKYKLKNKPLLTIMILIISISVGYSAVNTNLSVAGIIRFASNKYHAYEVGYTTIFNSLVINVEDALNDLFARHRKLTAEEVGYTNELNPNINNVQEALDDLYVEIPKKGSTK